MEYKLIHPTAFGFMPDVDVFDVIYPLNALRDWAHLTKTPLFILWIDAFKAYDSICWGGLFAYTRFCGMIRFSNFMFTVYTTANWAIVTGHGRGPPFTPHNGGAQGCPTTCPLYVMYVTPLLNKLDEHPITVWDIQIASVSYVDDLHTIACGVRKMRAQIHIVVHFNDLNENKIEISKHYLEIYTIFNSLVASGWSADVNLILAQR